MSSSPYYYRQHQQRIYNTETNNDISSVINNNNDNSSTYFFTASRTLGDQNSPIRNHFLPELLVGGVNDYYASLQHQEYLNRKDEDEVRDQMYSQHDASQRRSYYPRPNGQRELLYGNADDNEKTNASTTTKTKTPVKLISAMVTRSSHEDETKDIGDGENGGDYEYVYETIYDKDGNLVVRRTQVLKKKNKQNNVAENNKPPILGVRSARNDFVSSSNDAGGGGESGGGVGEEEYYIDAQGRKVLKKPSKLPPKRAPDVKISNETAQESHVFAEDFDYVDEFATEEDKKLEEIKKQQRIQRQQQQQQKQTEKETLPNNFNNSSNNNNNNTFQGKIQNQPLSSVSSAPGSFRTMNDSNAAPVTPRPSKEENGKEPLPSLSTTKEKEKEDKDFKNKKKNKHAPREMTEQEKKIHDQLWALATAQNETNAQIQQQSQSFSNFHQPQSQQSSPVVAVDGNNNNNNNNNNNPPRKGPPPVINIAAAAGGGGPKLPPRKFPPPPSSKPITPINQS